MGAPCIHQPSDYPYGFLVCSRRPSGTHPPLAALSQPHASILARCRRPRKHAALLHSPHPCEDARQPPSESVRDLPGRRRLPRKAGCCLIGFADAPTRLGQGSLAGFRHSGSSPPDAAVHVSHKSPISYQMRRKENQIRKPAQHCSKISDASRGTVLVGHSLKAVWPRLSRADGSTTLYQQQRRMQRPLFYCFQLCC